MMFLNKAVRALEKMVFPISTLFNYVALLVIFLLMLLTVTDVFGRWLFRNPVGGTFELTEISLAMVVFFALGYTFIKEGHIRIELLVSRFSRRVQAGVDCFNYLITLTLFALVVWQIYLYSQRLQVGNVVSGVLSLPIYLVVIITAIGCLVTALIALILLLNSLRGVFTSDGS